MVKETTVNRIRTLSRQGKSSNEIARQLRREGIGIRRKTILAYVRKFKGLKPKPQLYKYAPRKYRRKRVITKPRPKTEFARKMRQKIKEQEKPKHVAVYGKVKGTSKRIEVSGTGTNIFRFLIDGAIHPPKKRITRINADREKGFGARAKYIDYGEEWDGRPQIKS
jgi:IS30 family transposase